MNFVPILTHKTLIYVYMFKMIVNFLNTLTLKTQLLQIIWNVCLSKMIFNLVHSLASWMVGFYGIATFIGYLTPNPFYENSSILNNSV